MGETGTPAPTSTPTPTATPTGTPTPSGSPTPTPTDSPTPTPSGSPTPSPSGSPTPSPSGTTTPSPTPSDTSGPTPPPGSPSPSPTDPPDPTPSGPTPGPSTWPVPIPSPSPAAPTPAAPAPSPGESGQVAIDWMSIRELARLFDKAGDDLVAAHRLAGPLGGTSSLVGDDEDGRAWAGWYVDGYDGLVRSMNRLAEASFTAAATARDFEVLWDVLEQKIISSLPVIPDLSEPPIPGPPPHQEGA